ncbi:Fic family protein [Zavarzinia sp.]|uniref:Fic family protein n=1 Tax=Zavarzinia sp. TaxID=2027920 RepID=UPI00356832FA
MLLESVQRIEPALLEEANAAIADVIADLSAAAAALGRALAPRTAANLAGLVRIVNTYYSNLIEGHNTRPKDIERALAGQFHEDGARRNLQIEAAAHVRLQAEIDRLAAAAALGEPAAPDFLCWLHREFYRDATPEMLRLEGAGGRAFVLVPGEWRLGPEQDVAVGRHLPPSSERVPAFMAYFAERYRLAPLGTAGRIMALAAAHHRFNYIHPFPDGNGRVSRLMSHAMALSAGIGAHGLWSISRGLSHGLAGGGEYRRMMDHADMPRQGDLDGRDNLSLRALRDFVLWFLRVCLDQVQFMTGLLEIDGLAHRFRRLVASSPELRPEAAALLEEALIRGEVERGAATRITGLPERSARRVVAQLADAGLLASDTPKGPLFLRFPADSLDLLFPRLFAES